MARIRLSPDQSTLLWRFHAVHPGASVPVERGCSNDYMAGIMLRRLTAFLALFALGSLIDPASARPFPSLAKRPAEAQDRTVPAPEPIAAAPADAQLLAQVDTLGKQAASGDTAFRQQLDAGRKAVNGARGAAPSSDAWIDAEVAISGLDTARYESVAALAGLDTLYVDRQNSQDAARVTADLAAIDPARTQALAMVDAQNDALDGLRKSLRQP